MIIMFFFYDFIGSFCPRLSATRNLTRLLNVMDKQNHVKSSPSGCPRWDVIQDAKAVYLLRDMSGLPKNNNVEEFRKLGTSIIINNLFILYYNKKY